MSRELESRRLFLKQVAAGVAVSAAGLGLQGCNDDDSVDVAFNHGVASGDPLSDRVILWTRVSPSEPATLSIEWEVAADEGFTNVVVRGLESTSAARDYTVKVDVAGLEPAQVYYYRFKRGAAISPVGKTRTLPTGTVEEVRLGVFSCSNYPAGYFHVYAEAAKRDDLHAFVHLGDYIYEHDKDGYASQDAEALGRVSIPEHELLTLQDYRMRYAQYRSDKDLQAVHAVAPFICVWDDHEVANDSYKSGAENHTDATEGDYNVRRAAALQAYYEWLPIREQDPSNPLRIYRSFHYGDLLSLHMLDTRHIGRDKQLAFADYFDPATGSFDAAAFQADMSDPDRQMLGVEQTQWLQGQLASSGATWQVLGQQVLMGRMYIPSPLLLPDPMNPSVSVAEYTAIAEAFLTYQAIAAMLASSGYTNPTSEDFLNAGMTAEQLAIVNDPASQAIISAPSIPYNLDAWDGYEVARETVYAMARGLDKNLLVISGDTHNAWANDLQDRGGNQVGVEFAASSVSSPGMEEYLPNEDPQVLAAGFMQLIPTLKYANTHQRGYMVLTVTSTEARADWYVVDTVKSKDYSISLEKTLRALPGNGNRRIIEV